MSQLLEVGAVDLVGTRYVVGPSITDLARQAEPAKGLRRHVLPHMFALRQWTGASVALVGTGGQGAVVLEVVPGRSRCPWTFSPGVCCRATPPPRSSSVRGEAPERVDPTRRTAVDREHIIPGLHCFASAVTLPDGSEAALQIATAHPLTGLDDLRMTQQASRRLGVELAGPRRPGDRTAR